MRFEIDTKFNIEDRVFYLEENGGFAFADVYAVVVRQEGQYFNRSQHLLYVEYKLNGGAVVSQNDAYATIEDLMQSAANKLKEQVEAVDEHRKKQKT